MLWHIPLKRNLYVFNGSNLNNSLIVCLFLFFLSSFFIFLFCLFCFVFCLFVCLLFVCLFVFVDLFVCLFVCPVQNLSCPLFVCLYVLFRICHVYCLFVFCPVQNLSCPCSVARIWISNPWLNVETVLRTIIYNSIRTCDQ